MSKPNPKNERIKRAYFQYLKEAQRYSDDTVDAVAKALNRFEVVSQFRDFARFHREQAVAFKKRLAEQTNERTGLRLSKATLNSTLKILRSFFLWLAGQPGFKSRLHYSDADYFNLSEKDVAVARAVRGTAFPALDQIHRVLAAMPAATDIERRNRALVAFCLLTGARADALATVRLKHVDLDQGLLMNDARDMRTKASKTFPTWFFPVGGEAREIVSAWIANLRAQLNWTEADPLFPATKVAIGAVSRHFEAVGLTRDCWSNTTPIREVFQKAFKSAGLPYFNPHSIRKTLGQLGERLCRTPEEFKAWSQNLGHSGVLTTLTSYGEVSHQRQSEIIGRLAQAEGETGELTNDELIRLLRKRVGV